MFIFAVSNTRACWFAASGS